MTIAFLKGHAMNRGTLMVLKRFVIMALGALGLGALAAGPTFAQQIPAPDAYGDPQACAADIKVMKAAADKGKVQDNGLTSMQQTALLKKARRCAGDVGGGIAEARELYNAAVDATDELDKAQKRYDDDDSARNLEKRDEARTAHMEAVAARNAHSGGGAIYESVYAEEDRLAKAKAALSAYEKAETAAVRAEGDRDSVSGFAVVEGFAGFDDDGQAYEYVLSSIKNDIPDNLATAVDESLTYYVQIKKQGGALLVPEKGDDGAFPTLTTLALTAFANDDGSFGLDDNGNPTGEANEVTLALYDHDGDDVDNDGDKADGTKATPQVLRVTDGNGATAQNTTVGAVGMRYDIAKMALDQAKENLDDNQDGTRTDALKELVRRAKANYDYFAAQKARAEEDLAAGKLKLLGDNPETTGDNAVETDYPNQYTVEEYEALTDLQEARDDAADALKAAYDARVAATNDVEKNQRNTGAYLDQLVKLRTAQKAVADAAASDAEELTAAQETANEKLATAEAQLASYNAIQALDDANPVKALVEGLLATGDEDDDGQTLVDAIDGNYQTASDAADTANAAMDAVAGLSDVDGEISGNAAAIAALTAEDDPDTDANDTGPITENADGIVDLDGRVSGNENTLADHDMKLMAKKAYIDAIGAEMGFDAATGLGTGDEGMSRIDTNEAGVAANSTAITAETAARTMADTALDGRIDAEALAREAADIALDGRIDAEASTREMADTALGGRIDTEASAREMADTALGGRIDAEETARMAADTMLGGLIDNEEAARMSADVAEEAARMSADAVEEAARMEADTMLHGMIGAEETARMGGDAMLGGRVDTNAASITSNADAIAANMNSIGSNSASIADNRNMIGELSDDLSVVRAGVAASMALAGMPAINGRGISIGVGSFDGESAFAVGFQIQGEMASFKIGLTSGGGATGASAGVGFQF